MTQVNGGRKNATRAAELEPAINTDQGEPGHLLLHHEAWGDSVSDSNGTRLTARASISPALPRDPRQHGDYPVLETA